MQMGNCSQSVNIKSEIDPLFDLIVDKDLQENKWPQALDKHKQNTEHQSLMAKSINKELFEKLKNHKTAHGWTLAKAINTGTLYPTSFIGCHAGDLESYHDFKEFFYPVIEGCHFGFKMDGSMKHTTDIDSSKIKTKLGQGSLSKIISTRIRCARNLNMFPLNTVGTKQSRLQVIEFVEKVVKQFPEQLAGKLHRLIDLSQAEIKELIDLHYLFRGGDKMQAASGYHADWPYGRGIFLSNDKKFMMWINQGDHLRIISMETGGDIQSVFNRFSKAVTIMEATIKKLMNVEAAFLSDPVIGMIACCPSNLGTCMRGSVHILIPKLIKAIGFKQIDNIARKMGCQARGSSGEHSDVIDRIDISNWRRLGFPEYQLVEDMMRCANELARMEDEIKEQ